MLFRSFRSLPTSTPEATGAGDEGNGNDELVDGYNIWKYVAFMACGLIWAIISIGLGCYVYRGACAKTSSPEEATRKKKQQAGHTPLNVPSSPAIGAMGQNDMYMSQQPPMSAEAQLMRLMQLEQSSEASQQMQPAIAQPQTNGVQTQAAPAGAGVMPQAAYGAPYHQQGSAAAAPQQQFAMPSQFAAPQQVQMTAVPNNQMPVTFTEAAPVLPANNV